MPIVFIQNQAVNLPVKFRGGDKLDETSAEILNAIHFRRLKAKLKTLQSNGSILLSDLQTKAQELYNLPLVPYATMDDEDNIEASDPILAEAMNIARELLTAKLTQEGIEIPKNLDLHARQLVEHMPELHERARLRIETRFQIAQQNMGLKSP